MTPSYRPGGFRDEGWGCYGHNDFFDFCRGGSGEIILRAQNRKTYPEQVWVVTAAAEATKRAAGVAIRVAACRSGLLGQPPSESLGLESFRFWVDLEQMTDDDRIGASYLFSGRKKTENARETISIW
jgi:hypothetical protein